MHTAARAWTLAAGIAATLAWAPAPAAASTIEQLPGPLGCLTQGGAGGCGDSGPLLGARAIAGAPERRTAYALLTCQRAIIGVFRAATRG